MDLREDFIIMKFGGACFESFDNYSKICALILSEKVKPVVIASAKKGVTDRLLEDALTLGAPLGTLGCDMLISTGELQSAACLVAALRARGANAILIHPEPIFRTDEIFGDATILEVNTRPIEIAHSKGLIPVDGHPKAASPDPIRI